MTAVGARALLALFLLAMGCPRSGGSNREAAATVWHYEVRVAADLAALEATVCFEGDVPRALRPGKDEAAHRLLHARWLRPGPVRRLPVVQGHIRLDDAPSDGCLAYKVSLAEGGSLDAAVRPVGDDLIASPSTWLWRPERRAVDARATLRLTLPPGLRAALPWPREGKRFLLDASAFRFESYAAFGTFDTRPLAIAGVAVQLSVLDGGLAVDGDALGRYLGTGIAAVAAHAGGFPAPRLSVIVVPTSGATEPVPFGMMARGGGASLLLLMKRDATERALASDWVLPHELSHLLLPFIAREDAWLSEGFATYYQELLRARSGAASELVAMRRIVGSLRAVSVDPLSDSLTIESARMRRTHAYRQVYWGGAAFWLKADVALRASTANHASLDSVTAALRATQTADTVWTAETLVARLDQLTNTTLFAEGLAEAARSAVPAFEPTLEALGVRTEGGTVTLDDAARLAEIRRAMLAPEPRRTGRSSRPPAHAAPR